MPSSPEAVSILNVKVVPNASKTEIGEWDVLGFLKIRVQSPAQDGKANKAVIELLSKRTAVSKNRITILRGETNRQKVIAFRGVEDSEMTDLLNKKGTKS